MEALGDQNSILEPPGRGSNKDRGSHHTCLAQVLLWILWWGGGGGDRTGQFSARFLTGVKYLPALPCLTLMVFGPILQLRRLRLRRESDLFKFLKLVGRA